MGTSSPKLFDDDFALDVREQYLELLRTAASDAAALKRMLSDHRNVDDDPDEGPVFWMALAATMHEYGRLTPVVRARALEVIAEGTELTRWSARQRPKRKAVLAALAKTLVSKQPRAKKPPKVKVEPSPTHSVVSPGGASATAFEMGVRPKQLAQVMISLPGAGGGVFAANCREDEIDLAWVDDDTVQISYPKTARVESMEPSWFFYGRTIRCTYVAK